jgi:hypothetical protein
VRGAPDTDGKAGVTNPMPSKVLKRTTYIGRHKFNTKFWKTRERSNHGSRFGARQRGASGSYRTTPRMT